MYISSVSFNFEATICSKIGTEIHFTYIMYILYLDPILLLRYGMELQNIRLNGNTTNYILGNGSVLRYLLIPLNF